MAGGRDGRVRPPRLFGLYGELKEFNYNEAIAQQILHSILNGRFKRERVIAQFRIPGWGRGLGALEQDEVEYLRASKMDLAESVTKTMV